VSSLRKGFANLKSEVEDKNYWFGNESCGNEHHTQSATMWRR
jgi:YHS domain-containing protein